MQENPPLGFTGNYHDAVTAAYPLGNGYRCYLPQLLRFNAPDDWSPFGPGGTNPYAYCGDDPINNSDPSGHMEVGEIEEEVLGESMTAITHGNDHDAAIGAEQALAESMKDSSSGPGVEATNTHDTVRKREKIKFGDETAEIYGEKGPHVAKKVKFSDWAEYDYGVSYEGGDRQYPSQKISHHASINRLFEVMDSWMYTTEQDYAMFQYALATKAGYRAVKDALKQVDWSMQVTSNVIEKASDRILTKQAVEGLHLTNEQKERAGLIATRLRDQGRLLPYGWRRKWLLTRQRVRIG
jgi:RHS repeat-associated protein